MGTRAEGPSQLPHLPSPRAVHSRRPFFNASTPLRLGQPSDPYMSIAHPMHMRVHGLRPIPLATFTTVRILNGVSHIIVHSQHVHDQRMRASRPLYPVRLVAWGVAPSGAAPLLLSILARWHSRFFVRISYAVPDRHPTFMISAGIDIGVAPVVAASANLPSLSSVIIFALSFS